MITKKVIRNGSKLAAAFVLSTPFWFFEYPVELDANGGRVVSGDTVIEHRYFEEYTLPEAEKEHYVFAGWKEETANNQLLVKMSNFNKTYVAQWEPEEYTITYLSDGDEPEHSTYLYGDEVKLPEAKEKEHYSFKGWSLDGSDPVSVLPSGTFGEKTLTAVYEPDTYTITYEPDGGVMPDEYVTSYVYGVGTESLPVPTKEGYKFSRWYEDEDHTVPSDFVGKSEFGDKVYYAEWVKPVVRQSNPAGAAVNYGGGPKVIVGGYSAMLYYVDLYNVEQTNGVINAPYSAARWTLFSGADYIADHAYQGFSAMLGANTITIVEADGTVKTLHKSSTHYGTDWLCDDGVNVLEANAALVTQTCVGNGYTAFAFWDY